MLAQFVGCIARVESVVGIRLQFLNGQRRLSAILHESVFVRVADRLTVECPLNGRFGIRIDETLKRCARAERIGCNDRRDRTNHRCV